MMEASRQALVVPLKTMGPHWYPSGSWGDSESPLVPLWVLGGLRVPTGSPLGSGWTQGPHWYPSGTWGDSESPLVPLWVLGGLRVPTGTPLGPGGTQSPHWSLWVLEDLRSRPQQHPRPEEGGNMG
ncbi:unnamed protein product [Boreogadus saida]